MSTLRLTWELIRNMPRLLALRLEQFNLSLHNPEVIDGQHVCLRCRVDAPCPTFMAAAERIAALQ